MSKTIIFYKEGQAVAKTTAKSESSAEKIAYLYMTKGMIIEDLTRLYPDRYEIV